MSGKDKEVKITLSGLELHGASAQQLNQDLHLTTVREILKQDLSGELLLKIEKGLINGIIIRDGRIGPV